MEQTTSMPSEEEAAVAADVKAEEKAVAFARAIGLTKPMWMRTTPMKKTPRRVMKNNTMMKTESIRLTSSRMMRHQRKTFLTMLLRSFEEPIVKTRRTSPRLRNIDEKSRRAETSSRKIPKESLETKRLT